VLRGNHRQAIFGNDDDYRDFEDVLARALMRYQGTLFAYCWMTNHVHLAIRVAEIPLGAIMRLIASRYARLKQRTVPTTGHFFERRYGARLVDCDRYLLALVRYIHLNPVRASLVSDASAYIWSSHRIYLGENGPEWLSLSEVLSCFGSLPAIQRAAYQQFMRQGSSEDEMAQVRLLKPHAVPSLLPEDAFKRPSPPGSGKVTNLDQIAAAVAEEHGITLDGLRARRRHAALVRARTEFALRALNGAASVKEIAQYLGRSASTISELINGAQSR
jgi:REP element-mobilizing transposase RayT